MLILLPEPQNLRFQISLEIFLLVLQVLLFQDQYRLFPLGVGHLLLQLSLELLALFTLGIELSVGILFLGLETLRLFPNLSLELFPVHLDPVFVSLDRALQLHI